MPDSQPPGSLELLEAFVNTRSIELGTDEIASPLTLAAWLAERGLLAGRARVTADSHRRALVLREGLRALVAANNREPGEDGRPVAAKRADAEARRDLQGLARDLPLMVDVTGDRPRLVPRATGPVEAALAMVLAGVADAVASGAWDRMKACRDPACRWVYFDHSRNRSRAWCSMETCGNRAKARAFRQRRR